MSEIPTFAERLERRMRTFAKIGGAATVQDAYILDRSAYEAVLGVSAQGGGLETVPRRTTPYDTPEDVEADRIRVLAEASLVEDAQARVIAEALYSRDLSRIQPEA